MINKKNFEDGNFNGRANKIEQHPVFLLLSKNSNSAYTVKEITKLTNRKSDTIRSALRRLEIAKLIEHKTPYYILKIKGVKNNKK